MPNYKSQGIETAQLGVIVPVAIKQRLQLIARQRGWSISQTASVAIQEWLELIEEPKNDRQQ